MECYRDEVDVICCGSADEELAVIGAKANAFQQSGATTMGIIPRTRGQAHALYQLLRDDYDVNLLDYDSTLFSVSISIASVQMSMGSEFDEVLVPRVNQATYSVGFNRNLLYIACTRAMHKLSLTCSSAPAEIIQQSVHTNERRFYVAGPGYLYYLSALSAAGCRPSTALRRATWYFR